MGRYALIDNKKVVNIIIADDLETASTFGQAVDASGHDVGIGFTYSETDNTFSREDENA